MVYPLMQSLVQNMGKSEQKYIKHIQAKALDGRSKGADSQSKSPSDHTPKRTWQISLNNRETSSSFHLLDTNIRFSSSWITDCDRARAETIVHSDGVDKPSSKSYLISRSR